MVLLKTTESPWKENTESTCKTTEATAKVSFPTEVGATVARSILNTSTIKTKPGVWVRRAASESFRSLLHKLSQGAWEHVPHNNQ